MKWFSVLLLLLLVGCISSPITSGEVVDKQFVQQHQGKHPDIVVSIDPYTVIPGSYYTVPDRWYILIEKINEDDRLKRRKIQVNQDTYDKLSIGDWYMIPIK